MMGRRSIAGLLGGLVASPLARATAPRPGGSFVEGALARQRFAMSSGAEGVGSDICKAPMHDAGYAAREAARKLWKATRRARERQVRRQELSMALCGGWPPHIAVMESNALWFRAQRAAAWIEEREYGEETLLDGLRKQILGEEG